MDKSFRAVLAQAHQAGREGVPFEQWYASYAGLHRDDIDQVIRHLEDAESPALLAAMRRHPAGRGR